MSKHLKIERPSESELIAQQKEPKDLSGAIEAISVAMKKLLASGLNRRAIVVLLHDSTRICKTDIERVLTGLEELKKQYTCPK